MIVANCSTTDSRINRINLTRKEYNIAVEVHSDAIYSYALKFLKSSEDASDIVQDVFEKLWKNRKKVIFEKSKSWLFTCTHNALINFVKRQSKWAPQSADEFEIRSVSRLRYDLRQLIDMALNTLSPIQKSIILLRDMEGYDYKEIGKMLSLSDSQVKVYLFRARKKVKNELKGYSLFDEYIKE